MRTIELYGSDWCGDCRRAKAFLNDNNVNYIEHDIATNEKAVIKVQEINNGKRIIPTILVDGIPHTNPTNSELEKILGLKKKA